LFVPASFLVFLFSTLNQRVKPQSIGHSPITPTHVAATVNRPSENTPYHHLFEQGVWIADRSTNSEDHLLFQLQDYYVEVVFTRHSAHILYLNCFRDTDVLQPYLEEIAIDHLLR
jgi:hypothetical protein